MTAPRARDVTIPLLLFMVLTGYGAFASAESIWARCSFLLNPFKSSIFSREIPATGPRAIHYDDYGPGTYTNHADQFMQVIWPAFLKGVDVLKVRSPFFTSFVRQNLPALKRVHGMNYKYAEEDLKVDSEAFAEFKLAHRKVGNSLRKLSQKLWFGEDFTYKEMLFFAQEFASMHDRDAWEKINILFKKKDYNLLNKRYPKISFETVEKILEHYKDFRQYWRSYGSLLSTESFELGKISKSLDGRYWLMLPTRFPTGASAFFRTYHLPLNPLFIATEYEITDASLLYPPSQNLIHDRAHYREGRLNHKEELLPLKSSQNPILQEDIENFERDILFVPSRTIHRTFYFFFYYLRFESFRSLPITGHEITERLLELTGEDWLSIYAVYQRTEGTPFSPALDGETLKSALNEIAKIRLRQQSKN